MIRLPLAGLAACLLCGPALATPMSDDDFLSAFAVACLDGYGNIAARASAIDAAGWQPIPDDSDPVLARMLAISRQSLRDAEVEEGYAGTAEVYGRRDGDSGPYLVTTVLAVPDDGEGPIDVLGCHLYDFEAESLLDPAPIVRRFDEQPASVEDQPGIIVSQAWTSNPRRRLGTAEHLHPRRQPGRRHHRLRRLRARPHLGAGSENGGGDRHFF
jgi:hypothetical protein